MLSLMAVTLFSQFGLFHTVLKRHFSVRRFNLTLAARSWVQQNRQDFPQESFRAPSRHIWCTASRFSRVENNFVDRKIISSRFF